MNHWYPHGRRDTVEMWEGKRAFHISTVCILISMFQSTPLPGLDSPGTGEAVRGYRGGNSSLCRNEHPVLSDSHGYIPHRI